MPANWDVSQERKLLLAIIDLTNLKPPSWHLVSEKMGPGYSNEACRQHFQKIKRETRIGLSTPTAQPRNSVGKGKSTTPKPGKSTGSKRTQAESFTTADQDDDEEVFLSPLKGGSSDRTVISVDSNGSPKKVKLEQAVQNGPVCKAEELTADGIVDLVQDSLYA